MRLTNKLKSFSSQDNTYTKNIQFNNVKTCNRKRNIKDLSLKSTQIKLQ